MTDQSHKKRWVYRTRQFSLQLSSSLTLTWFGGGTAPAPVEKAVGRILKASPDVTWTKRSGGKRRRLENYRDRAATCNVICHNKSKFEAPELICMHTFRHYFGRAMGGSPLHRAPPNNHGILDYGKAIVGYSRNTVLCNVFATTTMYAHIASHKNIANFKKLPPLLCYMQKRC